MVTDPKKWPTWKVLHQLLPFFSSFKNKVYFWLCWILLPLGLFSSGGKQARLGAEHGLLIAVVSLIAAPWLWSAGSVVWHTSLVAPWHVGSSRIRDCNRVSCIIDRKILTTEHQGKFYSSTASSVKLCLLTTYLLGNLRKNKPKYQHLQILAIICWYCFCPSTVLNTSSTWLLNPCNSARWITGADTEAHLDWVTGTDHIVSKYSIHVTVQGGSPVGKMRHTWIGVTGPDHIVSK